MTISMPIKHVKSPNESLKISEEDITKIPGSNLFFYAIEYPLEQEEEAPKRKSMMRRFTIFDATKRIFIGHVYIRHPKPDGIFNIQIEKKYRKKGYGKIIVNYFDKKISRNKNELIIFAEEHAIPFWKKMGYVQVNNTSVMRKSLS